MKEKKAINVEVGQNVKQYREAANLTQESFAELVNLGVKHISAIECGAVGLSLTTLKRFSEVLAVSTDMLLYGNPDIPAGGDRAVEIQILTARLSRLPDNEFRVVKELLNKVMEAMAVAKENQ